MQLTTHHTNRANQKSDTTIQVSQQTIDMLLAKHKHRKMGSIYKVFHKGYLTWTIG